MPGCKQGQISIKDLFAAFEEEDLHTLQKLTESIRSFDRKGALRRTSTHDSSSPFLAPLTQAHSISSFDRNSLKKVKSIDKSEPLYQYSLTRKSRTSLEKESDLPVNRFEEGIDSDHHNAISSIDEIDNAVFGSLNSVQISETVKEEIDSVTLKTNGADDCFENTDTNSDNSKCNIPKQTTAETDISSKEVVDGEKDKSINVDCRNVDDDPVKAGDS